MPSSDRASTLTDQQRRNRREERRVAAPYRGMFATRIVAEFMAFTVAWAAVLVAGIVGAIPLWLGFLINTVLATTFYMPLHEATHGNIWGTSRRGRWGEDLIGVLSSVPLGFDYYSHRIEHMRHHAYTNDPDRDPDFSTHGSKRELPVTWWGEVFGLAFLPLFAFVPVSRRLLPSKTRRRTEFVSDKPERAELAAGKAMLIYWVITTAALVAAFVLGFGPAALWLWWVPGKLAIFWLIFVFAWFPHHPANEVGRYVDTRVAVFRGSTLLIRGHDHHALHHLFPRVPHYLLPRLWREIGPTLTQRGVRTEGRALGATDPIVW